MGKKSKSVHKQKSKQRKKVEAKRLEDEGKMVWEAFGEEHRCVFMPWHCRSGAELSNKEKEFWAFQPDYLPPVLALVDMTGNIPNLIERCCKGLLSDQELEVMWESYVTSIQKYTFAFMVEIAPDLVQREGSNFSEHYFLYDRMVGASDFHVLLWKKCKRNPPVRVEERQWFKDIRAMILKLSFRPFILRFPDVKVTPTSSYTKEQSIIIWKMFDEETRKQERQFIRQYMHDPAYDDVQIEEQHWPDFLYIQMEAADKLHSKLWFTHDGKEIHDYTPSLEETEIYKHLKYRQTINRFYVNHRRLEKEGFDFFAWST
jgi:hypothetical protein